jgi:hypothetical protein
MANAKAKHLAIVMEVPPAIPFPYGHRLQVMYEQARIKNEMAELANTASMPGFTLRSNRTLDRIVEVARSDMYWQKYQQPDE